MKIHDYVTFNRRYATYRPTRIAVAKTC